MVFEAIKRRLWGDSSSDSSGAEFVEIDLNQTKEQDSKIIVKTFSLKSYEDINPILNALREGYIIAVIDIKVLKSKDIVELKRVISKIKKTVEAVEGNIAGFGENVIIATPPFAKIERGENAAQGNSSNANSNQGNSSNNSGLDTY
jgi:SepF-like predicted cell division protein (DUF552 family)